MGHLALNKRENWGFVHPVLRPHGEGTGLVGGGEGWEQMMGKVWDFTKRKTGPNGNKS